MKSSMTTLPVAMPCSHKLSRGQRVKLLGFQLPTQIHEDDPINNPQKLFNNNCEIVNPQRFVVCEQTLPAEKGKTHFMGKNAKQSKKN